MTVAMFKCHDRRGTIPYMLVCDFRRDCLDYSDESHCEHLLSKTDFTFVYCQSMNFSFVEFFNLLHVCLHLIFVYLIAYK